MSKCDVLIVYDNTNQICFRKRHDLVAVKSVVKSVIAVQAALTKHHFQTCVIGIKADLLNFIQTLKQLNPKFTFNLCESIFGRSLWESNIPALLDLFQIPYTGSNGHTLALSLNKAKSKEFLRDHGLPVPNFIVFHNEPIEPPLNLRFPLIVKPLQEDGSIGIKADSVVSNFNQLKKGVCGLLAQNFRPVIVEEYIEGRELSVGILGNANFQILPISEIDFSSLPHNYPRILSYDSKWKISSPAYRATKPIIPAKLDKDLRERAESAAIKAYTLLNCQDYARIDLRLSADNTPYIIEVNPNPDISPEAGIVRSAEKAGLSYEEFILQIVKNATARFKNNGNQNSH